MKCWSWVIKMGKKKLYPTMPGHAWENNYAHSSYSTCVKFIIGLVFLRPLFNLNITYLIASFQQSQTCLKVFKTSADVGTDAWWSHVDSISLQRFTKAICKAFSSSLDHGESDRKWRNAPGTVDHPRRNPPTAGSTRALAWLIQEVRKRTKKVQTGGLV